ncbi:MAG: DUF6036 family nucleotidyltransferase [Candidatus Micrarchaeaceae archaeon]
MEFWNSEITEGSWEKLIELNAEIDMVVIGGWAVYLYTLLSKSKDIDIIIDYSTLRRLSLKYSPVKNDRLNKYEIKLENFDMDIYLPKYSKLALPAEDILSKYSMQKSGFRLPTPEALFCLKFAAFQSRKASIKGQKDAIDLLGILFYSGIDLKKLQNMANAYKLHEIGSMTLSLLRTFDADSFKYLNLNSKSFSVLKHRFEPEIKKHLL